MTEDDEPEYNGGYKKVFGVGFKQPTSRNFGLNEESILDDPFLVGGTLLSGIPVVGLAFAIAGLWVGFDGRHENPFCIDEQFWKSGVIGMVFQIIGLLVYALVMLA